MRLHKSQRDTMVEKKMVVEISEAMVSPLPSNQTKSTASKNITARGDMDTIVGATQACAARRHRGH
jgi:hypothetical protein